MDKAVVKTATGVVMNVIVIADEADWYCPDGCELIDAVPPAQPGATWDGTSFTAPVIPERSRLDVLMAEGPATQVYNEAADAMIDRPAGDIAADKSELLGLLQTKLADTGDLTWKEMNRLLALERES